MDYAAVIKESVSTPELFAYYGFERNRAGVVRCMFHQDNHASMKVYDGDRGYHCFSCKASGDVIGFVQQYFGLPFRDALSKINDDFRLGLPLNDPIDNEQRRRLRREADERRRQREATRKERDRLYRAYDDALADWIRLDRQRMEYAPTSQSDAFDDRYVEALRKIDYAAYVLDGAAMAFYEYQRKKK